MHLRANRHDDFFERPAGAVDLCGAMPPVRPAKS
jgi:peptidylprolyl isomerase